MDDKGTILDAAEAEVARIQGEARGLMARNPRLARPYQGRPVAVVSSRSLDDVRKGFEALGIKRGRPRAGDDS